jgi:hypothetical protein
MGNNFKNMVKDNIVRAMATKSHDNKSKDIMSMQGMIHEKINIESVNEMLDEVLTFEGDIDEILGFKNHGRDIEKSAKRFLDVMNKKYPKLKVKDLEKINTLLKNAMSAISSTIVDKKKAGELSEVEEHKVELLGKARSYIDEMTGAASAGGFAGPLFTTIIKPTGVKRKKKKKKPYNVKEQSKGFSKYLESDENPKGETEGLSIQVMNKILKNIIDTDKEEEEIDTNEATLSSSSGSYSTPWFLAKNAKNWRGYAKPLFKGGKFVKIKDKCKTYPYCNQGDIKALELFEDGKYSKLADKVAERMGEDPLKVKSVVLNDIDESLYRMRMKELNDKRIKKSQKKNKPNK